MSVLLRLEVGYVISGKAMGLHGDPGLAAADAGGRSELSVMQEMEDGIGVFGHAGGFGFQYLALHLQTPQSDRL